MGVLSLTYAFHICSKSLNLSIDFLISLMVFEKDETDDRDISNQMEVFYNFAHCQPIKLKNSFVSIISSGDNVDKVIFQFDGLGMMDRVDFSPDK